MAEKDTSRRGFGSMDEDKQREIAREGGHASHEKGSAHEFSANEAREAGRKGGGGISSDREHMSEIGRKGGEHSHGGQSSHASHGGQAHEMRERGSQSEGTRGGSWRDAGIEQRAR